jgi:hypothetical protein
LLGALLPGLSLLGWLSVGRRFALHASIPPLSYGTSELYADARKLAVRGIHRLGQYFHDQLLLKVRDYFPFTEVAYEIR